MNAIAVLFIKLASDRCAAFYAWMRPPWRHLAQYGLAAIE